MPSERELLDLRRDPAGIRALARALSAKVDSLSDFEADFVEGKKDWPNDREMSHRQAEVLLEIRDDHEMVTQYRGFSVARLAEGCWAARDDFDERDVDFLRTLKGKGAVLRKFVGRLARLAREAGVIEDYM